MYPKFAWSVWVEVFSHTFKQSKNLGPRYFLTLNWLQRKKANVFLVLFPGHPKNYSGLPNHSCGYVVQASVLLSPENSLLQITNSLLHTFPFPKSFKTCCGNFLWNPVTSCEYPSFLMVLSRDPEWLLVEKLPYAVLKTYPRHIWNLMFFSLEVYPGNLIITHMFVPDPL